MDDLRDSLPAAGFECGEVEANDSPDSGNEYESTLTCGDGTLEPVYIRYGGFEGSVGEPCEPGSTPIPAWDPSSENVYDIYVVADPFWIDAEVYGEDPELVLAMVTEISEAAGWTAEITCTDGIV